MYKHEMIIILIIKKQYKDIFALNKKKQKCTRFKKLILYKKNFIRKKT